MLEAFQRVKANKGVAGIDGESRENFENNLKKNLYKIWNRMSSGSYKVVGSINVSCIVFILLFV